MPGTHAAKEPRSRWKRVLLRTLLWTLILSASAAGGAYVAAHSNPFSPDVQGQGQNAPTPTDTGTSPPKPQVWNGTFHSVTYHDLYVGGRCTTVWNGELALSVADDGTVSGKGHAGLVRGPLCTAPVAQQQVKTYVLRVKGERDGDLLRLRLVLVRQIPAVGAVDLGGWDATVFAEGSRGVLELPIDGKTAYEKITQRVTGDDRDTFVSVHTFDLRCLSACG